MNTRMIAAVLGAAALAVPAVAVAKDGHGKGKAKAEKLQKGKAKGKVKTATYILKGTYASESTVRVLHGNSFTRKGGLVGQDVTLDFANAKLVVAESDGVEGLTLADVRVGDVVLVQAKGPRKLEEGSTLVARKLVDKTHPPVDDEDQGEDLAEAPAES